MKVSTDNCWLWARHKKPNGYAQIGSKLNGVSWGGNAHRILYEAWVGEIPEGYDVDHLCNVRCCVNPAHLEAVTHAENMKRRYGDGLCKRGHKLEGDNVYWNVKNVKTGRLGRQCRTCQIEGQRRRYQSKKENK